MTGKSHKETPGTPYYVAQAKAAGSAAKNAGKFNVFVVDIATEIYAKSFNEAKARCLKFVKGLLTDFGLNTRISMIFEGTASPYKEAARDMSGRQGRFSVTQLIIKHMEEQGIIFTEDDHVSALNYLQAQRAVFYKECMEYVLSGLIAAGFSYQHVVGILATTEGEQTTVRYAIETQQLKDIQAFPIADIFVVSEDGDLLTLLISLGLDFTTLRRFNLDRESDEKEPLCLKLQISEAVEFYREKTSRRPSLFLPDVAPESFGFLGGNITSDSVPAGTYNYGDAEFCKAKNRVSRKLHSPQYSPLLDLRYADYPSYLDGLRDMVTATVVELDPSTRSTERVAVVTTVGYTGLFGPVITGVMRPVLAFMMNPDPLPVPRNLQPSDFVGFKLGVSRLAATPSPPEGHQCLWVEVDGMFRSLAAGNLLHFYITGDCGVYDTKDFKQAVDLFRSPYNNHPLHPLIEELHTMLLEERNMPSARERCTDRMEDLLCILHRIMKRGELFSRPLTASEASLYEVEYTDAFGKRRKKIPRWLPTAGQRLLLDIMNRSSMTKLVDGILDELKGSLNSSVSDDIAENSEMYLSVVLLHEDFEDHPANHGCQPAYVMHYMKCVQEGGNEQQRVEQPGFIHTLPVVQLLEANQGDIVRLGFIGTPEEVMADAQGPVPKLGIHVEKVLHQNGQYAAPFVGLGALSPNLASAFERLSGMKFKEFQDEVASAANTLDIQAAAEKLIRSDEMVEVIAGVDAYFDGAKRVGSATKAALDSIVPRLKRKDDEEVPMSRVFLHSMPTMNPAQRLQWLQTATIDEMKQNELKTFAPIWPSHLHRSLLKRLEQKVWVSRYSAIETIHSYEEAEDPQYKRKELKIVSSFGVDKYSMTSKSNDGAINAIEPALMSLRAPYWSDTVFAATSADELDEMQPIQDPLDPAPRGRPYARNVLFLENPNRPQDAAFKAEKQAICNAMMENWELSRMGRRYSLPLSLKHVNDRVAEMSGSTAAQNRAASIVNARQARQNQGNEMRLDFTDQEQVNVLKMILDVSTEGINAEKDYLDHGVQSPSLSLAQELMRLIFSNQELCPASISSSSKYDQWISPKYSDKRKVQVQRTIKKVAEDDWEAGELAGRNVAWRRGTGTVTIADENLRKKMDKLLKEARKFKPRKQPSLWPMGYDLSLCDIVKVQGWYRIMAATFATHGWKPFSDNPSYTAMNALDQTFVQVIQSRAANDPSEFVCNYLNKHFVPRNAQDFNAIRHNSKARDNRYAVLKEFAAKLDNTRVKFNQVQNDIKKGIEFQKNAPAANQ